MKVEQKFYIKLDQLTRQSQHKVKPNLLSIACWAYIQNTNTNTTRYTRSFFPEHECDPVTVLV